MDTEEEVNNCYSEKALGRGDIEDGYWKEFCGWEGSGREYAGQREQRVGTLGTCGESALVVYFCWVGRCALWGKKS